MGDVYVALGLGGVTTSEDVTATRDKVLAGYTSVTSDSDDEPITGTMPDRGTWAGSVGMNSRVEIPRGYHNGSGAVSGPSVPQRGAWGASIGINGSVTIPQGYHNGAGKVTQSIPVQGGSTTTPGTANKTVVAANRYVNGNVVVAGDSKLVAANIKKGVTLFGVTGTFEGYVPTDTDLYLRGNNVAGFRVTGNISFQQTSIYFESTSPASVQYSYLISNNIQPIWKYSRLYIENDILSCAGGTIGIEIASSTETSGRPIYASTVYRSSSTEAGDWRAVGNPMFLDVSNVDLNAYIRIWQTNNRNANTQGRIYRIWLA